MDGGESTDDFRFTFHASLDDSVTIEVDVSGPPRSETPFHGFFFLVSSLC